MKTENKKGAGRPALYSQKMRRVNVMLDDETIAFYSTQGANLSEGIRKAWRGLTPFAPDKSGLVLAQADTAKFVFIHDESDPS
jgi:hypothetical protein